jgi:hypothetical protein
MSEQQPAVTPPLFPPWWFVTRYNEMNPGHAFRTGLDPMVMLAWHMASRPQLPPFRFLVTGC